MTARFLAIPLLELKNSWKRPLHWIMLLVFGLMSFGFVAGGVLLRHTIQVDPHVPDLLRPLYFELSEANLLQSMAILKRLIEQGG